MKLFTDCSGECCVCVCGEVCLAGHGDDYFSPASTEQIIKRLDNGEYSNYVDYMIKYLKDRGIEYKKENFGKCVSNKHN